MSLVLEFIGNSKIYNKERKEGEKRVVCVCGKSGVSRCDIYKMWLPLLLLLLYSSTLLRPLPRWRHLGDMRTTEHAIDGRP